MALVGTAMVVSCSSHPCGLSNSSMAVLSLSSGGKTPLFHVRKLGRLSCASGGGWCIARASSGVNEGGNQGGERGRFDRTAGLHSRKLERVSCASGRTLCIARASSGGEEEGNEGANEEEEEEEDDVLGAFMRHVEMTKQPWPLEGRHPTSLTPPTAVVRVLMDALMRNNWPEDNSGVRVAFTFGMPPGVNEMIAGEGGRRSELARAWYATEKYLTFPEFSDVVHEATYSPMLNFTQWEMASPLTFHGPGDYRAVQAVRTTSQSEGVERKFTFTFCLEKVRNGAYRGCWLVVGVRVGDYANV